MLSVTYLLTYFTKKLIHNRYGLLPETYVRADISDRVCIRHARRYTGQSEPQVKLRLYKLSETKNDSFPKKY